MTSGDSVLVMHGDLSAELAAVFADATRVACDVETTGLDWRRDRLGTCQLFTDNAGAVIVSLADGNPDRLMELLENPSVEKIFHHAPFDLRFMAYAWKIRPTSIRCTKVASKLLMPDAPNEEHSLQSLVLRHLGIRLQKGDVRTSDWTATNLTGAQLEYAAGDVAYLPSLLGALEDELRSARLEELYDDCCAFLPARVELELGSFPDVFAY
jgi:ribonuclease D